MVKTQLLHHDENIDGGVNYDVSKGRTRKELVIDFDPYGLLSKFSSLGYLGCLYLTIISFQNLFQNFRISLTLSGQTLILCLHYYAGTHFFTIGTKSL